MTDMRNFKTGFPSRRNFLKNYQKGSLSYKYKDKSCLKSPIDLAIYLRLIYDLKPRTLIEIGSKAGGSALLFRDITALYNLDCHIWSLDIDPVTEFKIQDVTFLQGDVHNLHESLTDELWSSFKKPVLVIEDSAHTYEACLSCLEFFKNKLKKDDFLVMEDGVLSELGLKRKYNGGPNRAIAEFFSNHEDAFEVATEYCDMFGLNVTYNPNGYLRKV